MITPGAHVTHVANRAPEGFSLILWTGTIAYSAGKKTVTQITHGVY